MNFKDLQRIIKENYSFQKYIYISNFFTCNDEKMKHCEVSLVKNIFGKYVVTKWLDYEYQKYSKRKIFSEKDLAADYAWKLFGGDEEFKKFLNKNK
jgi:hypothetical protein